MADSGAGPVEVVDHGRAASVAVEVEERRELPADPLDPARRRPPGRSAALADSRGIADQAGGAADEERAAGGRRAGGAAAVSTCTRLPKCRLGAVGSKPHVERHRPGGEAAAQLVLVGGLRAISPRHSRSSRMSLTERRSCPRTSTGLPPGRYGAHRRRRRSPRTATGCPRPWSSRPVGRVATAASATGSPRCSRTGAPRGRQVGPVVPRPRPSAA